jgi:2,3-bisphosphoglycerate-independent phosphoglycerate mutase
MVASTEENDFDFEVEDISDVEVEDDTPPEDRGREPMPKELVQELEADELEEYSEKVKTRLKQMKKVWHDERREKEREAREKYQAISVAPRMM